MIKTVIHDADNTLFDTRAATLARYNDVSTALGQGPLAFQSMAGLWSKSGDDVLAALFPAHLNQARQVYGRISPHVELVTVEAGIEAGLQGLHTRGIRCAIATNRREPSLSAILEYHHLSHYFAPEHVIPGRMTACRKNRACSEIRSGAASQTPSACRSLWL
jgi:phosphoglycolate phosphatase-like HAD superfamily hydrolase